MSRFIIISALFLLPFLTITLVSAQYELVTYKLYSDYITTYELDDFDEDESKQEEYFQWFYEQLVLFRKVFPSRISKYEKS